MNVEQYFRNRNNGFSNQLHICRQENRLYRLELEMEANKTKQEEMKSEFSEFKISINNLSEKLDANMKSINAKFFTVMGTSIVLLLGALGTLVFFLITK